MAKTSTPGLLRSTNRKNLLMSVVAVAALAVGAGYLTVQHASAATLHLCLWDAQSKCQQSNGVHNSVTIGTSNLSAYNQISAGTIGGFPAVMFQNSSGNCIGTDANRNVVVQPGACSSALGNEVWEITGTSPLLLKNVSWGQYMGTFGSGSGNKVYVRDPQTGFWRGWDRL